MNQTDLFADTFNGIAVTGNLVRIDLATLAPQPGGQPQGTPPQFETRGRLVMPIDGFLRAFALAEDVMKKLIAAGIVTQKPGAPATPAEVAPAAPTPPATPAKPSSPNFQ